MNQSSQDRDGAAPTESYWAASSRHQSVYPSLKEDLETDVAVVGAGFTGLSTAHHLERLGRKCTILEAHDVGWGASGRNGGMAVPRYKLTFPELERKYGADTAVRMYRLAHEAVDTLEKIVTECGLSCGFSRFGHITPIVGPADIARFEADVAWLSKNTGDRAPRMLDADETAARIGNRFYRGGYFEPRGAGIHPLEYCQDLARSLTTRGVQIFCRTPVESWSDGQGQVLLRSGSARVRARHLVIATNGYTDLTAAGAMLKRRIVPVASALVATSPLTASQRSLVLPHGQLATDAKRLTNYYRVMPDGRFIFGGRGGASSRATMRIYRRLQKDMSRIFPDLKETPIDYRWFGLVAVTLDSLPHIGRLTTRVSYGMGYNGRGVALATLFGSRLARLVADEQVDIGPMSNGRFDPIPFHALRVPAKQIAISYMQLRDGIDL